MRPRRSPRALGVLVGLALVPLAGCGSGSGHRPAVSGVTKGEVREVVQAPAVVTAKIQATITSPATGRVGRLLVHDGSVVKRGQVLMVISSPATDQRLAQAKAADGQAAKGEAPAPATDLTGFLGSSDVAADAAFSAAQQAIDLIPDPATKAAAQTRLATSKAQYANSRSQAEQAIQSLDEGLGGLSKALTTLAQAQRTQTKAAVALAQQAVASLTVKAPVAGTVQLGGSTTGSGQDLSGALSQLPSSVQGQAAQLLGGSSAGQATTTTVTAGAPVTAGGMLATLTDASALSLVADVDETDVLQVRRGIPGSVELDAVPDASYQVSVQTVGQTPTTSAEGGVTYQVRVSLGPGSRSDRSAAPRPRPGMSAVVSLVVRDARDAVTIPASALVHDGGRDIVWVDDNGRARRVVVSLGAQGDQTLQVLTGVQVGQRVVTEKAAEVAEGQKLPR